MCVAHMIHNAQRITSYKFYTNQTSKKAFLSLKFYGKYYKKERYMTDMSTAFHQ